MHRVGFLLSALLSLASTKVLATTLSVSQSGTFAATAPTTTYSAPDATFAFSFQISSNPTNVSVISNYDFIPSISNFSYTLNGVAVAANPTTDWLRGSLQGLLDVCFTQDCYDGDDPTLGFVLRGAQAYSGTTTTPTILTGSYTPQQKYFAYPNDAIYGYNDLAAESNLVIASTPEPSSLALLGTGVLAAVGVLRKRSA